MSVIPTLNTQRLFKLATRAALFSLEARRLSRTGRGPTPGQLSSELTAAGPAGVQCHKTVSNARPRGLSGESPPEITGFASNGLKDTSESTQFCRVVTARMRVPAKRQRDRTVCAIMDVDAGSDAERWSERALLQCREKSHENPAAFTRAAVQACLSALFVSANSIVRSTACAILIDLSHSAPLVAPAGIAQAYKAGVAQASSALRDDYCGAPGLLGVQPRVARCTRALLPLLGSISRSTSLSVCSDMLEYLLPGTTGDVTQQELLAVHVINWLEVVQWTPAWVGMRDVLGTALRASEVSLQTMAGALVPPVFDSDSECVSGVKRRRERSMSSTQHANLPLVAVVLACSQVGVPLSDAAPALSRDQLLRLAASMMPTGHGAGAGCACSRSEHSLSKDAAARSSSGIAWKCVHAYVASLLPTTPSPPSRLRLDGGTGSLISDDVVTSRSAVPLIGHALDHILHFVTDGRRGHLHQLASIACVCHTWAAAVQEWSGWEVAFKKSHYLAHVSTLMDTDLPSVRMGRAGGESGCEPMGCCICVCPLTASTPFPTHLKGSIATAAAPHTSRRSGKRARRDQITDTLHGSVLADPTAATLAESSVGETFSSATDHLAVSSATSSLRFPHNDWHACMRTNTKLAQEAHRHAVSLTTQRSQLLFARSRPNSVVRVRPCPVCNCTTLLVERFHYIQHLRHEHGLNARIAARLLNLQDTVAAGRLDCEGSTK